VDPRFRAAVLHTLGFAATSVVIEMALGLALALTMHSVVRLRTLVRVTALPIPLAALCAYALARLVMPGRSALLAGVLAISMFPQISIVPTLYLILRELRLLDTYTGLVLPYLTFTAPLAIWLLTAFFRQLPRELEEAALIDGAGRLRALRDVVLPLAAPGLASTAILTFLFCWNEFLFALSFTLAPDRYTVPVAIAVFTS
jgi:ABC-type glycerol-3-phosphate transport system permease component